MKKTFLPLFLSLYVCLLGSAQQLNRGLHAFSVINSPSQQLVEQAVKNGVYLIQQSYELSDSVGNMYGLGGRRAFGIDYSIGLKINDGLIINNHTVAPWKYNIKYKKYSSKYKPVLFETKISPLGLKASYADIEYNADSVQTYVEEWLYYTPTSFLEGSGFVLGGDSGINEGWIVWITKKANTNLSTAADLEFSAVKKSVVLTENLKELYPIDSISTSDEIIGAFFIKTEITGIGRILFRLCGMAEKQDNQWMLCCPFVVSEDVLDENYRDQENPNDEMLTPNEDSSSQESSKQKNTKTTKNKKKK